MPLSGLHRCRRLRGWSSASHTTLDDYSNGCGVHSRASACGVVSPEPLDAEIGHYGIGDAFS